MIREKLLRRLIVEYKLVYAFTRDNLVEWVAEAIAEGFEPIGGVAVQVADDIKGKQRVGYLQSMVRKDAPTE